MSKTRQRNSKSKRTRTRRQATRDHVVDVITQLACATRHPGAALLGGAIGGVVPWFGTTLAHDEIPTMWASHPKLAYAMLAVVLGCAVFSMLTVYKFGLAAFADGRKAAGYVVVLEGVMLVCHGTTSTVALALLVGINAVANGCVIALSREATVRRQAADARRSTTRAQNRARTRGEGTAPVAPASTPAAPASSPTPVSAPVPRAIPVVQGRPAAPARRPAASPRHPAPPVLATRPRWAPETIDDAEIVRYAYS